LTSTTIRLLSDIRPKKGPHNIIVSAVDLRKTIKLPLRSLKAFIQMIQAILKASKEKGCIYRDPLLIQPAKIINKCTSAIKIPFLRH